MPLAPPAEAVAWTRTLLTDRRTPGAGREQAQRTTWRLVAGSLVALSILVVAGYVIGARLAERQVLQDARHFSGLLANGVVGPRVTPALLRGDARARVRLDDLVQQRLVPHSSLRRVKVWTSDGEILYSDDHREIGKAFGLTLTQRRALRTNDSVAEVSDLSRDESALERELEPRLLEIYTGVQDSSGRRVLIETYLSYDQLQQQRGTVFRTLALLAGGAVLLFAGIQLALGLINVRWVRRQQAELDTRSAMVSERARQRLARDLHDGPIQDMIGASLLVDGALGKVRERHIPEVERLLEGGVRSVRSGIKSLRSVMIEVYPRSLRGEELATALEDLAEPMRAHGLDVEVEVVLGRHVSPQTTEAILRVTQEAMRNVLSHANATRTTIDVHDQGSSVVVQITDDGDGMPTGHVGSPAGHLGMRAMADIATERHGVVEVWSAPGQGTTVRMEVPR